ncbi:hypothetical protein [Oceanibaculum pacificum]|uniref:hypothetical protein n=1 Tax=Oceanibaculum pacificum TaxID=580166 RepID=UPI0018DD590E|nr:hypothetical protein [Oceanibaculum pacificum]
MSRQDDHVGEQKIDKTEARQGETSGHVRTVLFISLGLAVICLAIWFAIWR